MQIFVIIEYILGITFFVYFSGVVSIWICEFRMNILCKKMRQKIHLLERFNMSKAVFYAKMYKISEDHRKDILGIERVQQFILENVLMLRKSSLKIYPHANREC